MATLSPSTSRSICVPPRFAHLPFLSNSDGSKMSKQGGARGRDGVYGISWCDDLSFIMER